MSMELDPERLIIWDRAIVYGDVQNRVNKTIAASTEPISISSLRREVPAAFGSRGRVKLQAGGVERRQSQKQLAPRAVIGILVGVEDHKCVMMLRDEKIMVTSDVTFAESMTVPPIPATTVTAAPT